MSQDAVPPSAMIEMVKVSKHYPPDVEALVDISLSIGQGELVFLTGMSGAGKTTLLRLISRMERASKGMVDVAGFDVSTLNHRTIHLLRRKIGIAYQDFKLLPDRTVAENIAISMEVVYQKKALIQRRIKQLLEQLDLVKKYGARAGDLSRGEQQRVAIARAAANFPEILLADEPTGNLDAENTARVMDLFHQLHRQGATILVATHDKRLYEGAPHRIIELRLGHLLRGAQPKTSAPTANQAAWMDRVQEQQP